MAQKPFEVIAKCAMAGLPSSSDIAAFGERLAKAQRGAPGVVRAAPQPPAVFREGGYVLETRFLAWADDAENALGIAKRLLDDAQISCNELYLSGRALSETDTPRPAAGRARTTAPSPKGAVATAARPTAARPARAAKMARGGSRRARPSTHRAAARDRGAAAGRSSRATKKAARGTTRPRRSAR